jgi:hypothetical protein
MFVLLDNMAAMRMLNVTVLSVATAVNAKLVTMDSKNVVNTSYLYIFLLYIIKVSTLEIFYGENYVQFL